MRLDFSLDKAFWRAFTKTYWNRRPTVIRAPFPMPIVTPAEVFRAVVAARRRVGEPRDDLELTIGGRRIVLDLDRWLPRGNDVSLERYLARLKRGGAAGELALLINDFQHELGWTFYTRLRQFLQGLYEIAGVPPNAEVDVFLGNYRRTPSGVHRDEAEVFCFVVDGKKQFRLWPGETFRSSSLRYGPAPYDKYLKRSICLEGGPGDIIYWPSSYWHVAESDGRLGSSMTVALYYGYSMFVAMMKNIGEWYREIGGDERDPIGSLPFSKLQVPRELASTAQRAEGRPGRLTERLMRSWMERITGYGFARVPRARGRVVVPMGRGVRANPVSPILHWKFNRHLVITANGRSIAVAYDREIVRMLGRVSRGAVCEVADLTGAEGRKLQRVSRQALRRTLKFLLEERALEPA
ncbi:MAG TPA: cupin domain-containing protein [Candidatus Acidoferrales bacterium]|nr:cupin domain-containing protein [Candidatus Acidoferrales bacterium]